MDRIGTIAPARSYGNRILRFGKPEGSVLSGPMTIRGATGLRREAPPPVKQRLDGGEARTMTTLEVGATAKNYNRRKMKRKEKLGKNYEKR
jgi:hypothetical protein